MTNKSPEMESFLDNLSKETFGRSRKDPVCVFCGSDKVNSWDFRDELSLKEFQISRICQKCQDEVFGG
jgi:hypothetical protein